MRSVVILRPNCLESFRNAGTWFLLIRCLNFRLASQMHQSCTLPSSGAKTDIIRVLIFVSVDESIKNHVTTSGRVVPPSQAREPSYNECESSDGKSVRLWERGSIT